MATQYEETKKQTEQPAAVPNGSVPQETAQTSPVNAPQTTPTNQQTTGVGQAQVQASVPTAQTTQSTEEQKVTAQTTAPTTTPATPTTQYTQKVTITSPQVDPLEHLDTSKMEDQLGQWYNTAVQQQQNAIDHATQQGITELEHAKDDAQEQFQTQRNQIDIDEAKALDNQALYAEARGDRGGIGQVQYGQIQNAAATNRMTVNKAQTKLATDTARQIADLRAQGEFEKADAVLTLTQNYLSQLFQLGQWAAEYNLSIDQFNASLRQWAAEYEMGMAELGMAQDQWNWQVGQAEQENLANAGWAILEAGIMPSESQLAAMGLTPDQATNYLSTLKLSKSGGGSGRGTTDTGLETNPVIDGILGLGNAYAQQQALEANKDSLTPAEYEFLKDYLFTDNIWSNEEEGKWKIPFNSTYSRAENTITKAPIRGNQQYLG